MWRDARWVERTLADDSGEAQAELMQWSATNPRTDVANTLDAILGRNPPRSGLADAGCSVTGLFALFVLTIATCMSFAMRSPLPLILAFSPFAYVAWKDSRRPRIALRASLMLARLNDPRAVPRLIGCWRGRTLTRENEPLAEEITRLLSEVVTREPPVETAFPLRDFVERQFIATSRGYAENLTEMEADMYVSTLRCLARSSAPTIRETLARVARLSTSDPFRAVVIEAARVLLEPVPVPIPVSSTASLPPDPVQQVLRRD